jgi:hypothetical protein
MSEPQDLAGAGLTGRGISEQGGVVRRPAGRWTPSVHHLLNWLRSTGYELAPRPVGLTDTEDRLEFLPGRDQGWPFIDDIQTVEGAFECGRFARTLTDTLAGYPCPPDAVWQDAEGAPVEGDRIQHGDLGPWNLLWSPDGPEICGVIDWDQVEPGSPTYDVGFLAWFIVPVMDDERARARGFSAAPDRPARLRAYAEGAGHTPEELVSLIEGAQLEFIRRVVTRGADGDRGWIWTRLHEGGFHDSASADFDYLWKHFAGYA